MIFLLQKTLIYTAPLLIVALGGMFSERSGVINLALEGEMIFGAFIGAICARLFLESGVFSNMQLQFIVVLLISAASGAIFSLLLSFSAINLKADQTIGGTALNMLAPAIVNAFALAFFNMEKIQMPANFQGYVIKNPDATPSNRSLPTRPISPRMSSSSYSYCSPSGSTRRGQACA